MSSSVAAAEDVVALTVAGLAVRSAPPVGEADGQAGDPDTPDTGVRAALNAAGRGLAAAVGTAARSASR